MARRFISSGSAFEEQIGYSRAVVDGEWIFVSGCTGYDHTTTPPHLPTDIAAQTTNALANISSALAAAAPNNATLADVVRVRYFVVSRYDFGPAVWAVLKAAWGPTRPAATMVVVAGLLEEGMRIEIEVTARVRGLQEPAS